MMCQPKKRSGYMHQFYGLLMIFWHMKIYKDETLKNDMFVLVITWTHGLYGY